MVFADRPPCFHALRLPLGAPGLVPPCILHRRFPFTVGDWHSAPERVRAKQRRADASRCGCNGLIVDFSIFRSPCIYVFSDHSLPAFIDMHMAQRHVSEEEINVSPQLFFVADLARRNLSIDQAERVLVSFEKMLVVFHNGLYRLNLCAPTGCA